LKEIQGKKGWMRLQKPEGVPRNGNGVVRVIRRWEVERVGEKIRRDNDRTKQRNNERATV